MKAVLTTLLTLFMSSTVFAQACPVDENDPFSQEAVMPGGMYKGHCIDSSKFRSSRRLTDEEKAAFDIHTDENFEVVANFHHDGKFWIAIIPSFQITEVDFMFVPLIGNLPLFHGQLRFRLNGVPVTLIEQTKTSPRKSITLNEDVLFALYGVRAADKDQNFSMVKGLSGAYAVSYQLESISQGTAQDLKDRPDIKIRQYKLNLDQATAVDALETGISIASELGITRVYNTLSQSCLNADFLVLNRVLNKPDDKWLTRASESLDPIGHLKHMRLIYRHGASRIENYRP